MTPPRELRIIDTPDGMTIREWLLENGAERTTWNGVEMLMHPSIPPNTIYYVDPEHTLISGPRVNRRESTGLLGIARRLFRK